MPRQEPFKEVTVSVPVSSIGEAEAWYVNLLGSNTEVIRPVPGVVECKVAPGVWFWLFEVDDLPSSNAIIKFLVDDMALAQGARAEFGINTGKAIDIPNTVMFSEFADSFGNALGLYDLP